MSKEPLEALKELRQNNIDDTHLFDNKLFDIIETALKNYEKLINDFGVDFLTQLLNTPDDIKYKKLKALEIIKEKTKYFVDFDDNTKTIYIDSALDCDNEEYDLLKEVLKND